MIKHSAFSSLQSAKPNHSTCLCQHSQLEGSEREKAKKPECQLCSVLRLTCLNPGKLRNEINYKKAAIVPKHLHLLSLLWEWHLPRADLNYSNPPHSQVPRV